MSHLLWELTKNYNSFLVKRSGVILSADPYNLTNRNTYSQSGLIHKGRVAIRTAKKDAKATGPSRYDLHFSKKRNFAQKARTVKAESKTVNQSHRYNFSAEHVPVKGIHTASKIISKKLGTQRRSVVSAALRRLARVHRSNVTKRVLAKTGGK